ncbi:glycoside hydrolase family 99-like domain-containing protein [Geoalkalibacter halelectricus]|uniref:Glycoside hydrolase family 99-like domain-containing protein n=1 Tax=Geoalkalibacter halelectricus TaxID=2847045 RepID=A0ABY5ZG79_9BACT|nr:glycoside hydrolase family 99-like domain-containing protein [Geoalkalibacter halelectricus]UWZ78167.1 glycoside hydrolase family 99-like domain-containing protein [Geoalkalibacter halelectricus]
MIKLIKKFFVKIKAVCSFLNPLRFSRFYSQIFGQASSSSKYISRYVEKKDNFSLERDFPVRLISFYLPQFHPIPENDQWWGKGFTEWTNVSKAVPQFLGHYQPRLPGEFGFYDLRIPEILPRQAALAKSYGLSGFCFYFYWFGGKTLLEHPIELFLENKDIDFEFCLCWANENWTKTWDGLERDILIAQNHSPEDDIDFIAHIKKYLSDPRYVRIEGKPVLLVYRPKLLPDAAQTANRWRDWCRKNGVGEIYLVSVQSFEKDNPLFLGFDAATEFPPGQARISNIVRSVDVLNPKFSGKVFDYRDLARRFKNRTESDYPLFKAVCPGWDNEARRPGRGRVFHFSSPEIYAEWLEDSCKLTMKKDSEERMLFVNAWNEWAEGAYLEPDRKFGYAYLQATLDVVNSLNDE